MIVVAVARLPHGVNEREIGRILLREMGGDGGELFQRSLGLAVGRAVLERDDALFARGIATAQPYVGELGDRASGGDTRESAAAQDGGFERQLRRQAGAHL